MRSDWLEWKQVFMFIFSNNLIFIFNCKVFFYNLERDMEIKYKIRLETDWSVQ